MKQNRTMLGIVFYEQAIAVAEVENAGGAVRVRRSALFGLPQGASLEQAASLQTAFGAFLKEHGFKARKAAVGISTRHVLSTRLKVPPIQDAQTRYETIRLHLERKLQMEVADMTFDYWHSNQKNGQTIVALTTLRTTVDQIKSLLAGLKITPLWLTNTSLGLGLVTSPGLNCNLVEYPQSVEVFVFEDGDLRSVLSVAKEASGVFDAAFADKIVRQVHRTLWADKGDLHYYGWTDAPPTGITADLIKDSFGTIEYRKLTLNPASAGLLCDFAVRLGTGGLTGDVPSINFLARHFQQKKLTLTRQRIGRLTAFAAAILLLVGFYFYGWYSDRIMTQQYQQQLDAMAANVQAAQQMIDQIGYARQWFQQQPVHLQQLRELTLAFPRNSDIWLTSLAVDESLNQIITGRAITEKAILDVVDTLKSNASFEDIKLLYIRKMGKETDIMTFAINFHSRGEQTHGADGS